MKAVYMTEHGGADVLQYGDMPEPKIGPNDVKIRVRAASLNRLDVYSRAGVRGTRRRNFDTSHILGGDAAGEIVEVGSEVRGRETGQRVVVNPRMTCNQCRWCSAGQDEFCENAGMLGSSRRGSYAEYVGVPATSAVPIPDGLSFEEAATLPTVYLPTWTILVRKGALQSWETALVLSASAGVGTAGIQVAKNVIGATVITTTSTEEKAAQAAELGAQRLELANTQYYAWALENRSALMPTREQYDQAEQLAREARTRYRGTMEIVFVKIDYFGDRPKACSGGWARSYMVITPTGVVLPCHAAHAISHLTFESVKDKPLTEIWQDSPALNAYRGEDWMQEPCRSCAQRAVDFGGCRCQAFLLTGDAAAADPVCGLSPQHDIVVKAAQESPKETTTLVYRDLHTSRRLSA